MTMFPNCRAKYTKDAYPGGGAPFRRAADIPKDEVNPYWEKNLSKENKQMLNGFDCAMEEVGSFFSDIGVTIWEYMGMYDRNQVDDEVMCDERHIEDFDDAEVAKMSKQTYVLKVLQSELIMQLESTRDMLITGLIDGQKDQKKK